MKNEVDVVANMGSFNSLVFLNLIFKHSIHTIALANVLF